MKRISEYASDVEVAIKALDLNDREPKSLYAPIAYAMSAGGKRLRPVLTLMSAVAFGNEKSEDEAMDAALALEMFHNFTLLHDDVMDNSDTRRGRPAVHAKYDTNTAILSGDTMTALAEKLLLKSVPETLLHSVMERYSDMEIAVYDGQAYDMDFENRDNVSPEEYIDMVSLKTGALLGACASIGALLGGATHEQADKMYEFGLQLGIAFQIEDDRLDTFGDAATFGKPIGGDINNAKKTFLLTEALSRADDDAKALRAAMQLPAGDLRVRTATCIYEKMQMPKRCKEAVAHHSALAMAALKETHLPEDKIVDFKTLIDRLTGRRK